MWQLNLKKLWLLPDTLSNFHLEALLYSHTGGQVLITIWRHLNFFFKLPRKASTIGACAKTIFLALVIFSFIDLPAIKLYCHQTLWHFALDFVDISSYGKWIFSGAETWCEILMISVLDKLSFRCLFNVNLPMLKYSVQYNLWSSCNSTKIICLCSISNKSSTYSDTKFTASKLTQEDINDYHKEDWWQDSLW